MQDGSTAQRLSGERVSKVSQVILEQAIIDTSELVHAASAVVQEGAIKLETQVVLGHPGGNASMLLIPEEVFRGMESRSHRVVVVMIEKIVRGKLRMRCGLLGK